MRNENETLQASEADAIRGKIAQMRESVELTRSDIRRTKNDIEQYQGAHESHVRRTRALWVIVLLLVAGVAGISWSGPPLLREHQGLLGKMPLLQSTLNNINSRVMVHRTANKASGRMTVRASRIECRKLKSRSART